MIETTGECVTAWRSMGTRFLRIVIGTVLAAAVYGAISVHSTYQSEQRIARELHAFGGLIHFQYCGPKWIPYSYRGMCPFTDRVTVVNLNGKAMPLEAFWDLGSLTSLRELNLGRTPVTDTELEHLKKLTKLQMLTLVDTQVTDAGLNHLKKLINLQTLDLRDTQITDAGLEHLQQLKSLMRLFLRRTQITDAGLEHLKEIASLKAVHLRDTQITAEGRAAFRNGIPNCRIFPDE